MTAKTIKRADPREDPAHDIADLFIHSYFESSAAVLHDDFVGAYAQYPGGIHHVPCLYNNALTGMVGYNGGLVVGGPCKPVISSRRPPLLKG
jgi:hypothetical protein